MKEDLFGLTVSVPGSWAALLWARGEAEQEGGEDTAERRHSPQPWEAKVESQEGLEGRDALFQGTPSCMP